MKRWKLEPRSIGFHLLPAPGTAAIRARVFVRQTCRESLDTGADGGQTGHYMLRWVSTTGEKGFWSETASATIGA